MQIERDFVKDGGYFQKKSIEELFEVGTGSLISASDLVCGEIKRISAKGDNNGVIGLFDTRDLQGARHFENFITVNFFGDVFYHPYEASVEMKVHTLKLREGQFNIYNGLYFCTAIKKSLMGRFDYSSQLSSSKLKKDNIEIYLPLKNGKIAFKYMEQVMQELQAEHLRELQAEHLRELQAYLSLTNLVDVCLTDDEEQALRQLATGLPWRVFNVKALFGAATRGKRLKGADRTAGNLPFVTAGEADTGISAFIGNSVERFPANTVTIDMFGSAKYRNYIYGADDHVAVVHTQDLPKHAVLFAAAAMHKVANAGQFSYSRNFYAKDADALKILLPEKNGSPDWDLMARIARAVEKQVVAGVVAYSEREAAAYEQVVRRH